MSEDIDIKLSGPMFDGTAARDIEKMAVEVQAEIAKAAEDTWQSYMDVSFRTQSPAGYQSHVNIAKRDKDLVVNDGWPESGLKYGPWLEGIGSRNAPVTRFPGYHALKRARDMVDRQVDALAAPIVDKYVHEANS